MAEERLRIVLVTQSRAMGGMESHVQYLAEELIAMGNWVGVVLPLDPQYDGVAERCKAAGADILRTDTDDRAGRLHQVSGWWRFVRWARNRKVTTVHLHTGGATGGLCVIAAARLLLRTQVVRTEHDVPTGAPGWKLRATTRLADGLSHTVVAVSRRNAEIRRWRLRAPRHFAVVLNGVPMPGSTTPSQRDRIRTKLGAAAGTIVVGSVVRLAEGKGLRDLLHAFAIMRTNPPAMLVIVGGGPLRSELEALASALGISDSVRFEGHQNDPAAYYQAMDVFALAVPAGSMSIALLEAMSWGVPPVITFGGPEEAAIDGVTGLTARPADPSNLAEVLTAIVERPELRRTLATAAREHIAANLSSRRVAQDLLNVYGRCGAAALPKRLSAGTAAVTSV